MVVWLYTFERPAHAVNFNVEWCCLMFLQSKRFRKSQKILWFFPFVAFFLSYDFAGQNRTPRDTPSFHTISRNVRGISQPLGQEKADGPDSNLEGLPTAANVVATTKIAIIYAKESLGDRNLCLIVQELAWWACSIEISPPSLLPPKNNGVQPTKKRTLDAV